MYCTKCGAKLEDCATNCRSCGKQVVYNMKFDEKNRAAAGTRHISQTTVGAEYVPPKDTYIDVWTNYDPDDEGYEEEQDYAEMDDTQDDKSSINVFGSLISAFRPSFKHDGDCPQESRPMRFHKFFMCVSLPYTILIGLYNVYVTLAGVRGAPDSDSLYGFFTVIISAASVGLACYTIYGLYYKKRNALYTMFCLFIGSNLSSIASITFCDYSILGYACADILRRNLFFTAIITFIVSRLVYVYYAKRGYMFCNE